MKGLWSLRIDVSLLIFLSPCRSNSLGEYCCNDANFSARSPGHGWLQRSIREKLIVMKLGMVHMLREKGSIFGDYYVEKRRKDAWNYRVDSRFPQRSKREGPNFESWRGMAGPR